MSISAVNIDRAYVKEHYGTKPNDKFKIQNMPLFTNVVEVSGILCLLGAGISTSGLIPFTAIVLYGTVSLLPAVIALSVVAGITTLIALACFINHNKVAGKCITLTPDFHQLKSHPHYYKYILNNLEVLIKSGAISQEAIYRIMDKREEYSTLAKTYNEDCAQIKQNNDKLISELTDLHERIIKHGNGNQGVIDPKDLEPLLRRIKREIPNEIAALDRQETAKWVDLQKKQLEFLAYAYDAEVTSHKTLLRDAKALSLKLNTQPYRAVT